MNLIEKSKANADSINRDIYSPLALESKEQQMLKSPDNFSAEDKQPLIDKLKSYKDKYWIECSCKGVLIICQQKDNLYIRCKAKDEHKKDCWFYKRASVNLNGNAKEGTRAQVKYFTPSVAAGSILSSSKSTGALKSKRISKLGQLLLSILDKSGVNKIKDKQLPIIDQLRSITGSFNKLWPSKELRKKDITLSKFYRYSLTKELLKESYRSLIYQKHFLPKSVEPFLIFSLVATKITDNSFTAKKNGEEYFVASRPETISGFIDREKSAPYFTLALAQLKEDYKFYIHSEKLEFKEVFAIPIYSSSILMPVESAYERQALRILLDQHRANQYFIDKPLFPVAYKSSTEEEIMHRPDFILTRGDKTIFIEVLGSKNPDYQAHKESIAARVSGYICVEGYNLDSPETRHNFINNIKKYLS